MKKKVLFLCSSFRSGGAERAFVSLLNALPLHLIEAHVMALEEDGMFKQQLPEGVIIDHAPKILSIPYASIKSKYFWKHLNPTCLVYKLWMILLKKISSKDKSLSGDQFFWKYLNNKIPTNPQKFDSIISFTGGYCNYYAIDKIEAKNTYIWVHNDYNKINCDLSFDFEYFKKAKKVATISQLCVDALNENFPQLSNKFILIENISSVSQIVSRSQEDIYDFDSNSYDFTITSVGRLFEQKGYDLAIEAAHIMKLHGLSFCWYVIGEGKLRKTLEEKINYYKLNDNFKLLGLRSNPYPYIKQATLFVMTSRFEGKSIALDEAKILCKPIVSTKYPSVFDNIEDGINGILVEQRPQDIAENIEFLYKNESLRQTLVQNLKKNITSNEDFVIKQILTLLEL